MKSIVQGSTKGSENEAPLDTYNFLAKLSCSHWLTGSQTIEQKVGSASKADGQANLVSVHAADCCSFCEKMQGGK